MESFFSQMLHLNIATVKENNLFRMYFKAVHRSSRNDFVALTESCILGTMWHVKNLIL